MEKVRLGIIGFGNMGSGHVNKILEGKCPEVEVTAIADRKEDRREAAKKAMPNAAIFAEGEELIASGLVDAVHICTPHYQHPPLAISAFQHGLHVMCEKPAGVYTLQVREMIAEADKHPELTFGMMFNQRTNCVYRKVKEMLDNGDLGELKHISWLVTDWYRTQEYYNSGAWRATWAGEGGGVLLNQCPHQLDLLQWLCGVPSKVQAFCHEGKWHDIEVEDDVTAYMEFPNGATGVFITTTGDAAGTNRLEIIGTRGKIVVDSSRTITFYKMDVDDRDWTKTAAQGFGKPEIHVIDVETDGRNIQHPEVLNKFVGHILRGEPLVADGREGINGLMISNAMHLSSWEGHAVTLPIDENRFYELLMERCKTSRHKEESGKTFSTEGSY